ncbi:MAG: phage head closure protein [bacterium]|nr:phage head closure protein [bacterium]
MNIGQLTRKMTIEMPELTPDGGGGFTVAWQEVAEIYAAVTDLGGQEIFQDAQITSSVPARVVIHYRSDIDGKMRLVEGETVYDILSFRDPDGGKSWLEIIAQMK